MRINVTHALAVLQDIMQAGGMTASQAEAVARRMVASDLYGHVTHGLAMVPMYLDRLADGRIRTNGEITVTQDHGASFSWQCDRLPGAWVMEQALTQMLARIDTHPTVTATIGNCSHIGALQVYADEIAARKLLGLMMVTDPGIASVAPFGGASPVLTSNPLAVTIPTEDEPILIDFSTSVTSNSAVQAYHAAGRKLPGNWLLDNQGVASNDPAVLNETPPGTIMPLGGEEFGYKGFALGLMVEAYALALTGYGRHQSHERGGQGVFFQLINPEKLGGTAPFLAETSFLRQRCLASTPTSTGPGVRMPGQRAQERRSEQLANGLSVDDKVIKQVDACAARLGVSGLSSPPASS